MQDLASPVENRLDLGIGAVPGTNPMEIMGVLSPIQK